MGRRLKAALLGAFLFGALSFGTARAASAETAHLAVASNFAGAAKELIEVFEASSDHRVTLSLGSSGKLYAQILNGAPFDLFLSADQTKPEALEEQDRVSARHTYALGRLALWIPRPNSQPWDKQFQQPHITRIALANPRLAPYGQAAVETLLALGLVEVTRDKWVTGENIAQTFQFVSSGNATAGFISQSQLQSVDMHQARGLVQIIPTKYHAPIAQDAVLLKRGVKNPAAKDFYAFMGTKKAKAIIASMGYSLPEDGHGLDL